ncbi:MAG TPA: 23S rRNA (guanosine(2251)-2'-O)-methyltransferase RlmB [Bacteroidaceae bacterium]|nr:23S rRNA (guanosine(2251)-2'-O)-methyltransferase RlmB [Bacteroidaceae bacterium]
MPRTDNIIFGVRAIIEALEAGKEIEKVLVKQGSGSDIFREMIRMLRERQTVIQHVPAEKLNRITRKNHQGVIAYLSEVSYSDLSLLIPGIYEAGESPLVLILDQITDVRNFGAIARSAECAGVHAIVIPKRGSAMINADAVKTSAGALHKIPVCRFDNLIDALKLLKENGLQIFASTEKANTVLFRADLGGPAAIILGSEDRGISPELVKHADHLISIPMKGTISSLNVSVAAGIILFEAIRQRSSTTQAADGG